MMTEKTKLEELQPRIILQGIGGSQAYGTATPESDEDRLAIWLAQPHEVLGFTDHARSYHFTEPSDYHLHELQKFLSLVLKGNPTIMELLWLPDHEIKTDVGNALVNARSRLMARNPIASAYIGYAKQQLKRHGMGVTDEPDEHQKRRLKHLRHCYRLLLQAESFLRTGTLTVRLTPSQIKAISEFALLDYAHLEAEYQAVVDEIDRLKSPLPDEPDFQYAENLLIQARLLSLEGWNSFTDW